MTFDYGEHTASGFFHPSRFPSIVPSVSVCLYYALHQNCFIYFIHPFRLKSVLLYPYSWRDGERERGLAHKYKVTFYNARHSTKRIKSKSPFLLLSLSTLPFLCGCFDISNLGLFSSSFVLEESIPPAICLIPTLHLPIQLFLSLCMCVCVCSALTHLFL